jgi:hypothetical protein
MDTPPKSPQLKACLPPRSTTLPPRASMPHLPRPSRRGSPLSRPPSTPTAGTTPQHATRPPRANHFQPARWSPCHSVVSPWHHAANRRHRPRPFTSRRPRPCTGGAHRSSWRSPPDWTSATRASSGRSRHSRVCTAATLPLLAPTRPRLPNSCTRLPTCDL